MATRTHDQEVLDCCSLVLDVVERSIIELQQSDSGDFEDGDVLVRKSERMVQWVLSISPHIDQGDGLLRSVIAVREAVFDQVQACTRQQRGRPLIPIRESHIRFHLEHNFTIQQIANMFGCSRRTVERRMREYGINSRDRYSHISDSDLVTLVSSFVSQNPNLGERSIDGSAGPRGGHQAAASEGNHVGC